LRKLKGWGLGRGCPSWGSGGLPHKKSNFR